MIRFFMIICALILSSVEASEPNGSLRSTDYSTCVLINDKRGKFYFLSEIALTPAQRQNGMMFRTEVKESDAMLFVFEKPKELAFWMKNVKIPLDMLFFDGKGKLNEVKSNVQPCRTEKCPTYPAIHDNNQFVLELKAGTAEKLNLSIGAKLGGMDKSNEHCRDET